VEGKPLGLPFTKPPVLPPPRTPFWSRIQLRTARKPKLLDSIFSAATMHAPPAFHTVPLGYLHPLLPAPGMHICHLSLGSARAFLRRRNPSHHG